jgi:3-hydroxyacyl-CoA dehydrogenase
LNSDRHLAAAKERALELYNAGYTQPVMREDVEVLGKTGLAALYAGAAAFKVGNYASEHDEKIARKIAYVLCGGDLSTATKVSEQYLLDLEARSVLIVVR